MMLLTMKPSTYIVNGGHQEEDDGCDVKDEDPTEDDQHDDDAGGRIREKVYLYVGWIKLSTG